MFFIFLQRYLHLRHTAYTDNYNLNSLYKSKQEMFS